MANNGNEDGASNQRVVRSSAAEYLTFIAASGGTGADERSFELRYEDENIWLSQKLMAEVYGTSVSTINEHLKRIFKDGELAEKAVIRDFRITASDGKRYRTKHYNLQAIVAVGFKVNNARAVQFRKWAGQVVKDFTIQGWVMDAERLKSGHMFTDEYFERQLDLVREIRASERKFYQKVTDLYATAFDYDPDAATTHAFFALVQNKLHWATHRHTAAELIVERADADRERMGLTTWAAAPHGKIVRSDVSVAKNYLASAELDFLNRLVSMYLDYAELQASRKIPMSMEDWASRLDGFLEFNETEILTGPGRISHEQAKLHAETEFEKYRIVQDHQYISDFDRFALGLIDEGDSRES
ncbi:virulence RhuM family protein [Pseudoclavibacter sp. CFCC 11306]|uniref:virulence RhuM family protein n=1 Tax=Pseudoclavibacter sp. CFCC 11306 TaxID=1564493 RepID=UPI001300CA8D|nr:virulence RhuM family protein [Pseudoclavibacter sp. CFCC 11306]KAB1656980.1 virulence RhuM family protein [Pseudoclavibacter sp. CFCC 11306]